MLGFGAISEMMKSFRQNREAMKSRKKPGSKLFLQNSKEYKTNILQKISDEELQKFSSELKRNRRRKNLVFFFIASILLIFAMWLAVYLAHLA